MKKVYRSLFDSDEVYEVEEITDNPEISTEEIAEVKQDNDGCESKKEHTVEDCWNAIMKLQDALISKKEEKEEVKDDEPAVESKVEAQKANIDKSKSVNDEEEEKVEEEEVVEDSEDEEDDKKDEDRKDVKDSYAVFASVRDSKCEDLQAATQVAFQNRYNKVANK